MFCHKCGAGVETQARFCQRCGAQLDDASRPSGPAVAVAQSAHEFNVRVPDLVMKPAVVRQPGRWRGVSFSGAVVMLVAFLLPWVAISCDSRALGASAQNLPAYRFSGFDLAVGPRIQTPLGAQQGAGSPLLWLVPAAAFVVIAAVGAVVGLTSSARAGEPRAVSAESPSWSDRTQRV